MFRGHRRNEPDSTQLEVRNIAGGFERFDKFTVIQAFVKRRILSYIGRFLNIACMYSVLTTGRLQRRVS